MAGDVEQVLGREVEPGERAVGGAGHVEARAGHEGADLVGLGVRHLCSPAKRTRRLRQRAAGLNPAPRAGRCPARTRRTRNKNGTRG